MSFLPHSDLYGNYSIYNVKKQGEYRKILKKYNNIPIDRRKKSFYNEGG